MCSSDLGKLAFSFGNVAQDEGSAMAQFAWKKGWRTADLATDNVIVYFKNVVQAFAARWKQLGGKIVDAPASGGIRFIGPDGNMAEVVSYSG